MKFAIVALCLVAMALAAPVDNSQVQLLSYENDNIGLGDYKFAYELSDGTKREEKGELKNVGTENEAMYVTGSYTWVDPDGQLWTITFIADENGFQPTITQGAGISGPLVASLLG